MNNAEILKNLEKELWYIIQRNQEISFLKHLIAHAQEVENAFNS